MTEPTILERRDAGVCTLTFNRPRAKNAFNEAMYGALADALAAAATDRSVRVVVLTGAGDAFCAGQDLSEMGPVEERDGPVGFDRLLDALSGHPKPLIAAVNGVGLGLGLTMLLHTDINYVATTARFKCPFVTLGVVPEAGSSFLLPRMLGRHATAELLLTARWLEADEAVALGLARAAVAPDRLLHVALETAHAIAKMPPEATQATKRLLKAADRPMVDAARRAEADAFRERLGSPENREAVAAFFEKRAPRWD